MTVFFSPHHHYPRSPLPPPSLAHAVLLARPQLNHPSHSVVICRYDRDESLSDEAAVAAGYCLTQLESKDIVNYCVFTDSDVWDEVQQSDLSSYLTRFIADVITARAYVFGFGFGVALLVGFLYIGLLQIPGLVAVLVWACVTLVLVGFIALGAVLWNTATDWEDAGTKDQWVINMGKAAAAVSWVSGQRRSETFQRGLFTSSAAKQREVVARSNVQNWESTGRGGEGTKGGLRLVLN